MTYWRRRFLALAAGLAVLAVIAWAFSGVLDASGGNPTAGSGHGSKGHGTHARGAEFAASRVGGTSDSRLAPPSPAGSPPSRAAPSASAGSAPPGPVQACKPADVVLSLFATQAGYGPGQLPEFDVDVVSTSARTCSFNVGPRYLALVITAGGKRVWSSADCVAGHGSLPTDLVRGVPTAVPLSWDRESSAPGCTAPSRQVTAGSFTADASDGGLASNSVAFKLS